MEKPPGADSVPQPGEDNVCSAASRLNSTEHTYTVTDTITTNMEPVPLKYGKLATKYPWTNSYFYRLGYIRFRNL